MGCDNALTQAAAAAAAEHEAALDASTNAAATANTHRAMDPDDAAEKRHTSSSSAISQDELQSFFARTAAWEETKRLKAEKKRMEADASAQAMAKSKAKVVASNDEFGKVVQACTARQMKWVAARVSPQQKGNSAMQMYMCMRNTSE